MITKIFNKIFSDSAKNHSHSDTSSQVETMTIQQLSEQSGALILGYQRWVTMQQTVPLKYLMLHHEMVDKIPEGEADEINPYFIWQPKLDSKFDFLSKDKTMASSIGPIPTDGGKFLPFLIELRTIIERPRDKTPYDFQEAQIKTNKI